MRVDIELYGDTLVSRKLLRFGEQATNMEPVWDDVEDVLKDAFERNFQQEGPGWTPLRPGTIRDRIRQGYAPGPILTRSGAYRRSLTTDLQTHKSSEEMTVVAPLVPGQYHQSGTRRMPSRPIRLKEEEKQDVVRTIQRSLIEGYS